MQGRLVKSLLFIITLLISSLSFANTQKLSLTPDMVRTTVGVVANAGLLVDEQELSGDPLNGDNYEAMTLFRSLEGGIPIAAEINLGIEYVIEHILIYDKNGNSTLTITSGSDASNVIDSFRLNKYKQWVQVNTNVETQFLQFSIEDGRAAIGEIVIYGYPKNETDVIPPNPTNKIVITPEMFTTTEGTTTSAGLFADEQDEAGDPLTGDNYSATTTFRSLRGEAKITAELDLAEDFVIKHILFYDRNGISNFTISHGEEDNQTEIAAINLNTYKVWRRVDTNVTARYLQFSIENGLAAVPEVVIYGYPYVEPVLPIEDDPEYAHLFFGDVSEERKQELNDRIINSPTQPYTGHPRLYGDNTIWSSHNTVYENFDADCTVRGKAGWGAVPNAKISWEKRAKGGATCENKRPTSLLEHNTAKFYLTGQGSWSKNNRLQVLYLIRDEQYCHSQGGDCISSPTELDELKTNYLNYEFERLRGLPVRNGFIASWHKGYNTTFFDLGAGPVFQYWCLLLDIFWDDETLLTEDREYLEGLLSHEIDSYIESYDSGHWSIYNGNNWTAILGEAAMFWAILYYYEDDRAQDVFNMVLDSMWLTHKHFLSDSTYEEGVGYAQVMYGAFLGMNQLLRASFDQYLPSVQWAHHEKMADWMLDTVSTDGLIVDFGDVWAKQGFASFHPMSLVMWRELIGLDDHGTTELNACHAKRYFSNIYYDHAFYNPWDVEAAWARDWYSLVEQCTENDIEDHDVFAYPQYGYGVLKSYMPGANFFITSENDALRYSQMDFTSFYLNGVPNYFAHREIDYGGVIWSTYGSRIFWDFGYGEISNKYEIYSVRSSKGYYKKESEQDRLEFYIKHIDGNLDFSGLEVRIKVDYTSSAVLASDYAESPIGSDWVKVSIPLDDYNIPNSRWEANDGDGPTNGQGIHQIEFKVAGKFGKGNFGLDEIHLTNGTDTLVWYGDTYNDSIQENALILNQPDRYYIEQEAATGGANSESWIEVHNSTAGRTMGLFYTPNIADRRIKNMLDHSPLGTNTLVIPDVYENNKENTNVTQIDGERGTVEKIEVSQLEGIHLDGSDIYGANNEELGWFEYFDRWSFPLENGHFLLIDSFKLKDSRPAKEVQEFFYSSDGTVDETCSSTTAKHHVDVTLEDDDSIYYKPKCSLLDFREDSFVEARMIAASINTGNFQLGAPDTLTNNEYYARFIDGDVVTLKNRTGNIERRKLVRYVPSSAIKEDIRVFLLTSAAITGELQQSEVNLIECEDELTCFELNYDDMQKTVVLSKPDGRYQLQSID
jgi:hypothetical protein